jgi:hypothetical protein
MSELRVPEAARFAAQCAARRVPATCNRCGVEYIEYEGPCQEERCRGTVAFWPDTIADAALGDALPAIYADVRERLLSEPALQAAADAICIEKPASAADRNEVRIEIEAAFDALQKGGGEQ